MMRAIVNKPVNRYDIYSNFDRIFDSMFDGAVKSRSIQPRVDVKELKEAYVLEADLPGVHQEQLEIKIEDNLLTFSVNKEKDANNEEVKYLIRERSNAEYKRSFVLPKDANSKDISANLKDGQLTLNIPKKEEAKPVTIQVNTK